MDKSHSTSSAEPTSSPHHHRESRVKRTEAPKENRASKARTKAHKEPSAGQPKKGRHDDLAGLVSSLTSKVHFTNLDKVLYPELGLTKASLLAYYAIAAEWMLPHVVDRPLTIVRCPNGPHGQCFYQKHAKDSLPPAMRRIADKSKSADEQDYMVIDDRDGLLAAMQLGTLEIHTWGCRAENLEHPDSLVFDLDPHPSVSWQRVVSTASALRRMLDGLALDSWVRTTGGKGLHLVVPIQPTLSWDEVKGFTKAVSTAFANGSPNLLTVNPLKAQRTGKIFIDYLRNGRGATAIAPYSTRARPEATVATPVSWEELEAGLDPLRFDVATVPVRLQRMKIDPWGDMLSNKQRITAAARHAVEKLALKHN